MTHKVLFSEAADNDIAEITAYLLPLAGVRVTDRYVKRLLDYCQSLNLFPNRGVAIDARSGLRLLGYRKQATIAFSVEGGCVTIVRIFHHGRNIDFDLE
ncbi:type II toxin-antitoxin system RelE/ParE family toxin [Neorhizobium sp. JUb45]|uniref:type II toxin-antitoxin system RelE/ParE family toxin n=1 Tax=unclassified Neorhizobium TaxID=2629175 RepID=UPI00104D9A22|nr:type II toxin-antitoxin system RelE/ParE family toxin [Neorhizobium sp. JUb45]TCR03153.1 plasmid stabilization system protein ParE [Neorhizobium sp. JUb45]